MWAGITEGEDDNNSSTALLFWRLNECMYKCCVWVESMTVVLTCCVGHTSHSADLLTQDIRYRLHTDRRLPLVPWTAAEIQEQLQSVKRNFKSIIFTFIDGVKLPDIHLTLAYSTVFCPSIMIYGPANSNWNWLTLIDMWLESASTRGRAGIDLAVPFSCLHGNRMAQ